MNKIIWLVVASLVVFSASTNAEYLAYSNIGDKKIPFPENINKIDVKYLVNVDWTTATTNKVRVGVLPVQNNSSISGMQMQYNGVQYSMPSAGGGVPVQGIEAIITTVMNKTGRFQMLERSVLDQALKEQDLGSEGRITKQSSSKIGKILGAQYLIQAVVTNYESGVENKSIGGLAGLIPVPGAFLLGGLSASSSKGVVGMNFRIIDPQTSEILFTDQVEVSMEDSGVSFGGLGFGGAGGMGGFLSNYSKTPIGQAVIAAVNKGLYEIIKSIGTTPLKGSIIKAKSSNNILINIGSKSTAVGDVFKVMSEGEEIIDPDTGMSLGGEGEHISDIVVTKVKAKYSISKIKKRITKDRLKRGMVVVSYKQPKNLEFASNWVVPKSKSGAQDLFDSFGSNDTGNSNSSSDSWGEDNSGGFNF